MTFEHDSTSSEHVTELRTEVVYARQPTECAICLYSVALELARRLPRHLRVVLAQDLRDLDKLNAGKPTRRLRLAVAV